MKTKLILIAVGAVALAQIAGAQSVITGIAGDDIFSSSLIGDVPVVNVAADTTPDLNPIDASLDVSVAALSSDDAAEVSQADTDANPVLPASLLTAYASPDTVSARVANNGSADSQSTWDSSASDSSSDLAADAGWLNYGIVAAPDLSAVENESSALSYVVASDVTVDKAIDNNSFVATGANAVADIIHPNVAVPEPGTLSLFMLGGTALVRFFRRK